MTKKTHNMKESAESTMQAFVNDKPAEAMPHFDALVKEKIASRLDDMKVDVSNKYFGNPATDNSTED